MAGKTWTMAKKKQAQFLKFLFKHDQRLFLSWLWSMCSSAFCNWDLNLKGKLFGHEWLVIFFGTLRKQPLTEEFLSGWISEVIFWTWEIESHLTVLTSLESQDLCRLFVCSVLKQALSHITFCGIQLAKPATVNFSLLLRAPATIPALQAGQIVWSLVVRW